MDDFQTKFHLALWGAAAGGVASLMVNLFLNSVVPRITRWNLTRQLKVNPEESHGSIARCRVKNGGYWTIGQAIAYLWIECDPNEDVLRPPEGYDAFIKPGSVVPVSGQLCWSVRAPRNPIKVDIFAKERQPLGLCAIDGQIMVPSEAGWEGLEGEPTKARAFLVRKKYFGVLKIVSADTNARYFQLEIDPERREKPVAIHPLRFSERWKREFV